MSQAQTRILFIDSDNERANNFLVKHPQATVVTSSSKAVEALSTARWDIVCIEHELGPREFDSWEDYERRHDDGMKVVDHLLIYNPVIKRVYIHSNDFDTAVKMRSALQAGGYPTFYMSFSQLLTFESV